jgi:hypothetical protein
MVEVVYEEPNFSAELQPVAAPFTPRLVEAAPEPDLVEPAPLGVKSLREVARAGLMQRFRGVGLLRHPFWFQPNFISAIVSLILIAALLTFWFSDTKSVTVRVRRSRCRSRQASLFIGFSS